MICVLQAWMQPTFHSSEERSKGRGQSLIPASSPWAEAVETRALTRAHPPPPSGYKFSQLFLPQTVFKEAPSKVTQLCYISVHLEDRQLKPGEDGK